MELSFEKRICATPEISSVADKVRVIDEVRVVNTLIIVPVGGVLSSLIPDNVVCGSSLTDDP